MKKLLESIHQNAIKLDAPVFEVEKKTANDPFKILVFTMLSARSRDSTTLKIVEKLFSMFKTPSEIAKMETKELESMIYGVGFYKTKAKNLINLSKILSKRPFPNNLEKMLELPGVGRKTANIVLARVFGINTIGVDVHVHRISNRLGLVKTKKPIETEKELIKIIDHKYLKNLNRDLVAFGQTICLPRNPKCQICPISQYCKQIGVVLDNKRK